MRHVALTELSRQSVIQPSVRPSSSGPSVRHAAVRPPFMQRSVTAAVVRDSVTPCGRFLCSTSSHARRVMCMTDSLPQSRRRTGELSQPPEPPPRPGKKRQAAAARRPPVRGGSYGQERLPTPAVRCRLLGHTVSEIGINITKTSGGRLSRVWSGHAYIDLSFNHIRTRFALRARS